MIWAWFGHLVLLAVFFWWTGISDATRLNVALSFVIAVLWLVAFFWVQKKIFVGAQWGKALLRPRFWGSVILFIASLAVAKLMIGWIPEIHGTGWQLFSFILRFGLAWTLVNATWTGIAWQTTLPPSVDGTATRSLDE